MENRINEDDLELVAIDGGGEGVYHHNGIPFTGTMFALEEDGSLSFEQEYQDGYSEGWYRSYYPNGQISEEYQTHNNLVVDGTFREWDEQGTLTFSDKE